MLSRASCQDKTLIDCYTDASNCVRPCWIVCFPHAQAQDQATGPSLTLPTCLTMSHIVNTLGLIHTLGLVHTISLGQCCSTLLIVHIFDILCLLLSSLALVQGPCSRACSLHVATISAEIAQDLAVINAHMLPHAVT